MPNDAKLGLVAGVGLVIAIAVVFYRKDVTSVPQAAEAAPAAEYPTSAEPESGHLPVANTASNLDQYRPTAQASLQSARRHVVAEGETLPSLAKHYYGDGDKSVRIYQANMDRVPRPERLTPGTVLVIPE